jgi:hypothetical protein
VAKKSEIENIVGNTTDEVPLSGYPVDAARPNI